MLLGSFSEMDRRKLPCIARHATDPNCRVLSIQGLNAADLRNPSRALKSLHQHRIQGSQDEFKKKKIKAVVEHRLRRQRQVEL